MDTVHKVQAHFSTLLCILVFSIATCIYCLYYVHTETMPLTNHRHHLVAREVNQWRQLRLIETLDNIEDNDYVHRVQIKVLSVKESLAKILSLQADIEKQYLISLKNLPQPEWHNYISPMDYKRRYYSVREHIQSPKSLIPASYFQSKKKRPHVEYLLNNARVCDVENLFLMVIVMSSAESHYQRHAIRETWARMSRINGREIRMMFAVGKERVVSEYYQDYIHKESMFQKDMIQGNFTDTLLNLTVKTNMIYHWLATYCPNARFVVRVTENTMIDPFRLISLLESGGRSHSLLFGLLKPTRAIETDNENRYEMPWEAKTYPMHLARFAIVMTGDTVFKLFVISERTPEFYPDYLHMSLLTAKAGILVNSQRELFSNWIGDMNPLRELKRNDTKIIFAHVQSDYSVAGEFSTAWEIILDRAANRSDCMYWVNKGQDIMDPHPVPVQQIEYYNSDN